MSDTVINNYEGYQISFSLSGRRFVLKGRDKVLDSNSYESYDKAIAAIDNSAKAQIKVRHEKLGLDVLKHDGSGTTKIKGINLRLGRLTFMEGDYSKLAQETYGFDEVYPVADWIKEHLAEKKKLNERLSQINRDLRKVEIKTRRSYGNIESSEAYDRLIEHLKREYESAVEKAKAGQDAGNIKSIAQA